MKNETPSAISAGHETTLAVAKEILQAGGNAFDAAIAAYYAMFITEPCMASAGGNGFALCKAANESIQFFDFFAQTPLRKHIVEPDFYPVLIDFGGEVEEFHVGLGAAAVPGTIAGIFAIHERYGTLPMKELVMPAIALAKEGVRLNTFQSFDLGILAPIYQQDSSVKDIFFKDGAIKKEGDLIQMKGMADFLDFIAREETRGFYYGEMASQIAQDSRERGGFLQRTDFEQYKVNILEPLRIPYKNKIVHLPNGPSKGGAALAMFLASVKNEIPSLAIAMQKAQQYISEESEIEKHLKKYYPTNNFRLKPGNAAHRGTSHFNVMDNLGNAISLTSSIGEGCGYFIPGTDMQLNNMLGEIFLLPNGAHSWTPNTRMHSMMTPTMVTDLDGKLEFISGSGGATRIPYAIGQVMYHLYEQKKNLQQAIEAPRYHFGDGLFQVEGGAPWPYNNSPAKHWEGKGMYFGGVHAIFFDGRELEAVGDARRYGVGEVF